MNRIVNTACVIMIAYIRISTVVSGTDAVTVPVCLMHFECGSAVVFSPSFCDKGIPCISGLYLRNQILRLSRLPLAIGVGAVAAVDCVSDNRATKKQRNYQNARYCKCCQQNRKISFLCRHNNSPLFSGNNSANISVNYISIRYYCKKEQKDL